MSEAADLKGAVIRQFQLIGYQSIENHNYSESQNHAVKESEIKTQTFCLDILGSLFSH